MEDRATLKVKRADFGDPASQGTLTAPSIHHSRTATRHREATLFRRLFSTSLHVFFFFFSFSLKLFFFLGQSLTEEICFPLKFQKRTYWQSDLSKDTFDCLCWLSPTNTTCSAALSCPRMISYMHYICFKSCRRILPALASSFQQKYVCASKPLPPKKTDNAARRWGGKKRESLSCS